MNITNTKILFLALSVAALTSCSTAYKMGQTPDDVYYSPAKIRASAQQDDEYVSTGNQPQRYTGAQGRNNNAYDSYEDFDSYRNDRFLRMSVGNSLRMGAFNDYYMYDGYSNWKYNNYAYNINTPWNSYYYWNNYYNPYNTFNFYNPYYGGGFYGGGFGGGGVVIVDKGNNGSSSVSRPRAFAPSNYTNNNYSNSNLYLYRNNTNTTSNRPGSMNSGSRYNNNNSGNNNTMRRLPATGNTYYNSNNNNTRSLNNGNSNNNSYSAPRNNTYEAPSRSYTPSSSPSSSGSSGGSSGGGGGVSRPSRGN